MTQNVKKISAFIFLAVIPFGAVAGRLAYKAGRVKQISTVDAAQEADAPFRDGYYLGGLDAKNGRQALASIGRWNDPKDRASFVAGYQRGYEEARRAEIIAHRD
jgi:hypothetical protein